MPLRPTRQLPQPLQARSRCRLLVAISLQPCTVQVAALLGAAQGALPLLRPLQIQPHQNDIPPALVVNVDQTFNNLLPSGGTSTYAPKNVEGVSLAGSGDKRGYTHCHELRCVGLHAAVPGRVQGQDDSGHALPRRSAAGSSCWASGVCQR